MGGGGQEGWAQGDGDGGSDNDGDEQARQLMHRSFLKARQHPYY